MSQDNHLFIFGLGYVGTALAEQLLAKGWRVSGTSRDLTKVTALNAKGITAHRFDGDAISQELLLDLKNASHILSTVAPDADGDPVLAAFGDTLKKSHAAWVGYLSTSSVYGNHDGRWVDEETPTIPTDGRGQKRLDMETAWQKLGLPLHIFRVAGIYGPDRNSLVSLQAGTARCIVKQGHVFCRIHRDDIASCLSASAQNPTPNEVFNLSDDAPSTPQDPLFFAANLLKIAPPPVQNFEDMDPSPMLKSFYANNRRIANAKMKKILKIRLAYPSYREGLTALHKQKLQGD